MEIKKCQSFLHNVNSKERHLQASEFQWVDVSGPLPHVSYLLHFDRDLATTARSKHKGGML